MKTQDLRAALAAERRRREEVESKLSRALENNTALARGNLRLQEQCARLRGEADLRQHDEGCQRAAAAAREQEATARLAHLQTLVRRGAEEREALLCQLAGKQEVIAYLETMLAERAADDHAEGSRLAAVMAGAATAGSASAGKAAGSSYPPNASMDVTAPMPAGREPQQRVQLLGSEEEEAPSGGEEASSSSRAGQQPASGQEAAEAGGAEAATFQAGRRGRGRTAAAGEDARQPQPPSSPATSVDRTPLPPQKQQPAHGDSASAVPPTILRTSLRSRNGISYTEPSLSRKLRQGDPFTFGAAEAAAAGGGKPRGRARTKPRPRFAASTAQHSDGQSREALPPVAD